jgi:hypothetical protein
MAIHVNGKLIITPAIFKHYNAPDWLPKALSRGGTPPPERKNAL